MAQIEIEELKTYEPQMLTIYHLMKSNVKEHFSAQQFKIVLDPANAEAYLPDVALRLVSQFYD
jgi:hypothetical protein